MPKLKNNYDDLLGIRTWGGRMVGADGSTELWRHPYSQMFDAALPSEIKTDLVYASVNNKFRMRKNKKAHPTLV